MTQNAQTSKLKTSAADDDGEVLTLKERVISELKFFAGLFAFILVFFTTVWGHYKIPSESMLPTLEVGDHVYVSKFTYGYSRHSLPCLLYTSPSPRDRTRSRMPSSA